MHDRGLLAPGQVAVCTKWRAPGRFACQRPSRFSVGIAIRMDEQRRACAQASVGNPALSIGDVAAGLNKGGELGIGDFMCLNLKTLDLQAHSGAFFGIDRGLAFDEGARRKRHKRAEQVWCAPATCCAHVGLRGRRRAGGEQTGQSEHR